MTSKVITDMVIEEEKRAYSEIKLRLPVPWHTHFQLSYCRDMKVCSFYETFGIIATKVENKLCIAKKQWCVDT